MGVCWDEHAYVIRLMIMPIINVFRIIYLLGSLIKQILFRLLYYDLILIEENGRLLGSMESEPPDHFFASHPCYIYITSERCLDLDSTSNRIFNDCISSIIECHLERDIGLCL